MHTTRAAVKALPALAVAALLGGCCSPTEPDSREAVVVFAFEGSPADTLRVLVRHGPTIEAARQYVRTGRGAHIPTGPIVRGAGVDPRYPFHFVPDSVRLAEITIELCDGAPMRTPEEVDEFMRGATGNPAPERATWCPWSARPVRVE